MRLLRTTEAVQQACQPAATTVRSSPAPVLTLAPLWHTRALVLLILAVAITGSLLGPQARPAPASRLVELYLPLLVVNLSLAFYVSRFGLGRSFFWDLFSRRSSTLSDALGNAAWAAGLVGSVLCIEKLLEALVGLPDSAAAHVLTAQSQLERACWLGVAACVGFSEELVYRGYLQRQLAAQTGNLGLAIAFQAALFGIAHAEQGQWAVARFGFYGLLFGGVAASRHTILPCVLAHVALDISAGLGG